jgi:hypothetical protein
MCEVRRRLPIRTLAISGIPTIIRIEAGALHRQLTDLAHAFGNPLGWCLNRPGFQRRRAMPLANRLCPRYHRT